MPGVSATKRKLGNRGKAVFKVTVRRTRCSPDWSTYCGVAANIAEATRRAIKRAKSEGLTRPFVSQITCGSICDW